METKHTPGPWRPHEKIVGWDNGRSPACAVMFQTSGDRETGSGGWSPVAWALPHSKTQFEALANARLIAAAPDFAEAAPDAADFLEHYADFIRRDVLANDLERHPYLPAIEKAAEDLRAAIRKATPPTIERSE